MVTVNVLSNDLDPDGDPLSLEKDSLETATPELDPQVRSDTTVQVHTPSKTGTYLVSYTVSDGRGGSARGTLTVYVQDDAPLKAPIARDDFVDYDALPTDWDIYQIILLADSTTFASYMTNMRQLAVDKLQDPEMVIFNRCTDATDKAYLHRAVRMVNRRAQMAFERTDGSVDPDDVVDELPFDTDAPVIDIADEDFGLWYLDAMDNLDKYMGKTVRFKGYVCQTPRVPKGCFVPGRFGMTCCAEDISFIGFIMRGGKRRRAAAPQLGDRDGHRGRKGASHL
mgnify:CR=1 FL=1